MTISPVSSKLYPLKKVAYLSNFAKLADYVPITVYKLLLQV